jgi:hypothetical protein
VSELGDRLAEEAGGLAREEGDLRKAAAQLVETAGGDDEALRQAQRHWAEALHEQPESSDALGALVLIGAALYLRDTQGS